MPFDPYAYADAAQRMAAWEAAGKPSQGSNAQYGTFDLDVRGHDALAGFRGSGITDPFSWALNPAYGYGTPPTSSPAPAAPAAQIPGVPGAPALGGAPVGGAPVAGVPGGAPFASTPFAVTTPPMPGSMVKQSGAKPGSAVAGPTGNTPPWLPGATRTYSPIMTMGPGSASGLPPGSMTLGAPGGTQFPFPTNPTLPGTPGAGPPTLPGTTTGQSMSGLDPQLEQLFRYALGQAYGLYTNPNGLTMPGGGVAPLNAQDQQAQQLYQQAAQQALELGGGATEYASGVFGGALNPANNPALQDAIAATLNTMRTEAAAPGGPFASIRDQAMDAGQFGGTRQGVAEGVATGRFNDTMARTVAEMNLSGLNQSVNAANNLFSQMPNYASFLAAPGSMVGAVGGQNRAYDQALRNERMQQWLYSNYEPERRLAALFSMLQGGLPVGSWSSTGTTLPAWANPNGQSGGLNWAALLAGGAGLYNLLQPGS